MQSIILMALIFMVLADFEQGSTDTSITVKDKPSTKCMQIFVINFCL